MTVTFLGTGTSQGIPVIACHCPVCTSVDSKDKRLRTSVMISAHDENAVIDSGPDFRYQMLRANVDHLTAVVFTHEHKDHIAGLDDIRAFNYKDGRAMDVYATAEVQEAIIREFSYVFSKVKYPGLPLVNLMEIENKPFYVNGLLWQPIEVMHYKLPVMGYRIGNFTYITDAKTIRPEEKLKMIGSKVLVLNALQQEAHISHFTLSEAIALAQEISPEITYFTHLSHRMGKHEEVEKTLPRGMHLAYDGLTIDIAL